MIRSVTFRNFKSLRNATISLEPLTVLVGPNASGKTSVLQGLHLFDALAENDPQVIFKDDYDPKYFATIAGDPWFELELALAAEQIKFRASRRADHTMSWEYFHSVRADRNVPWQEKLRFREFDDRNGGLVHRYPELHSFFFRLDARKLKDPSFNPQPLKRIGHDGGGLASVLSYIALNQPDSFAKITQLLKRLFPFVSRIRFDRIAQRIPEMERPAGSPPQRWCDTIIFDMAGAPGVPVHGVSDGTMLVLGLITALVQNEGPTLILLDDLDQGLHPRAQKELVLLLRSLFRETPGLQIVATTHSPYLLDHLQPEEIRLTTRLEDGSVACAGLREHPDFDRWKEAMSPGEFWSLVGEEWVAGKNHKG